MSGLHRGVHPEAIVGRIARHGRDFVGLLRAAWVEYERDHARYLAAAMVYYALVSLIPLLLLLLSVLGLVLRYSDYAAAVQGQVLSTVEATFGPGLRVTVEQLLTSLQQESITATVIGVLGLLLAASVLFRHLRLSFRAIWKYAPPLVSGPIWVAVRASFFEKAFAYVLVLMSGGLVLIALALIGIARSFHALFEGLPVIGSSGSWLIMTLSPFTVAAMVFAFLFRFVPPISMRWRDVWLAALLCAVGWTVASVALSLYGAYFGSHVSAYGAVGALLAVMLWMKLISQILYFGAELCKVITVDRLGERA